MSAVRIAPVSALDLPALLDLMRALADFEHLPPPEPDTGRRLRAALRGRDPRLHGLIARRDGRALGYALYFFTYSTFLARPTLYLEDLFVLPEARRDGIGGRLFRTCVRTARRKGCGRVEWAVLDWNRPAHRFYRKEGGSILKDWQLYRLPLRP